MTDAQTITLPPPLRFTPDELRSDAALARFGLRMTRARIKAALSAPCTECGAKAGHHCYGSQPSRVRGFCGSRWAFAQGTVTASQIAVQEPGELGEYAATVRMAQVHARLRTRAQEREAMRAGAR